MSRPTAGGGLGRDDGPIRFLSHGAERSGPPLHLLRLCRWWATQPTGLDAQVVLARPGELSSEFAAVAAMSTARLDRRSPERIVQRGFDAAGLPAGGSRLLAAAIRQRARGAASPAATVVNGATAANATLLRALARDEPVLLIAHELSTGWRSNLGHEQRAFLLDRVGHYAAVSHHVGDYLVDLGVDASIIEVIPPAVEMPRRRPDDPGTTARGGDFVIGGGGVTDWRKAPELWLGLAAAVRSLAPELTIRFVWFGGNRPDDAAGWPLRHEVDHLGLAEHVTFTGPIIDTGSVLSGLDLFVSTAREDAAPLVCAEAASHGVPVVTFDSGGATELVTDGRCGVVVPYPDLVTMATAVVQLLGDPQRRSEFGRSGMQFVMERQHVSVVADATAAWVRSALR